MNRVCIIVLLVLITASCSNKKALVTLNVKHATESTAAQGYFYFLPRTVVAVDVAITKTISQPGPFAQYAESLLGLEQVIRTPSVDHSISEINIHSYAEPDPDHLYFIEDDLQNSKMNLSLSETGLIQSVNKPFNSGEFMRSLGESKEYGHFGSEATFNYFIDINLQEKIDTILERVRLDTITVERQTLRRSWVEKSTDIRAKEVAEHILKIRDERFNLITGFAEITYSKEAIAYMYEEMIKKENDYLALFTGITSASTIRYRYTFTPDLNLPEGPHELFYFSVHDGVMEQNVPGSIPVSIHVKRNTTSDMVANIVKQAQNRGSGQHGFFYRIPEHSNISIFEGNRPRAEARMLINQYGIVTSLPPSLMEIEFYPNTGSIKSAGRIPEDE
jgi:hypothetical protein